MSLLNLVGGKVDSPKTPEQYIRQAAEHLYQARGEEAPYMAAFADLATAEIAMATYLMTFASINR